jgi:hypothetical protein
MQEVGTTEFAETVWIRNYYLSQNNQHILYSGCGSSMSLSPSGVILLHAVSVSLLKRCFALKRYKNNCFSPLGWALHKYVSGQYVLNSCYTQQVNLFPSQAPCPSLPPSPASVRITVFVSKSSFVTHVCWSDVKARTEHLHIYPTFRPRFLTSISAM